MTRIKVALLGVLGLIVAGAAGYGAIEYRERMAREKALEEAKAAAERKAAMRTEALKIAAQLDDILDEINGAIGRNRMDHVMRRLEEAIQRYPESAALHVVMGRAFIIRDCGAGGAGCSERAKDLLVKATKLETKQVEAYAMLVHHGLNSGCAACAEPWLARGTREGPDHPLMLAAAGRFQTSRGMLKEAEASLLDSIKRQTAQPKKNSQTYQYLAQLYNKTMDLDKAESAYTNSLELLPESPWRNGNLGVFLICARVDYERAIPYLEKALSIMTYQGASSYLALALYERWADAYLKDPKAPGNAELLAAAQRASPDVLTHFFDSLNCSGGGRFLRAALESNLVPKGAMDEPTRYGLTPLAHVIQKGDRETARWLLAKGANANARAPDGWTPAMLAAYSGDVAAVEFLIAKGADVNASRSDGNNVMMFALRSKADDSGSIQILKMLEKAGLKIAESRTLQLHPVLIASSTGKVEVLRWVLSKGYPYDFEAPGGPLDPMLAAIHSGHEDVVRILIEAGFNVSAPKVPQGRGYEEMAQALGRTQILDLIRKSKRT